MSEFNKGKIPSSKEGLDAVIDHGLEKSFTFIIRRNGSNFEAIHGHESEQAGKIYSTATSTDFKDTMRKTIKKIHDISNSWALEQSSPVHTFGIFMYVWYDGTTYHGYYTYTYNTKFAIGHCTSSNGVDWTNDTVNNPVLEAGASGWDQDGVAVMVPWKEGTDWYALYRGSSGGAHKIGLVISSDGVNWSKSGSNPVIDETGCQDPSGIIKVGSTYYLFANSVGGDRSIWLLTCTNLIDWTLQEPAPLFDGRRFCSHPFKYNGIYYLLVSRYYDSGHEGVYELWKDNNPEFYPSSREFLGIAHYCTSGWIDTPSIITDTINRDTFPNNKLEVYVAYSSEGNGQPMLIIEDNIANAIASTDMPEKGKIFINYDSYSVTPDSATKPIFEVQYGLIIESEFATIKLVDSYNSTVTFFISISDDSIMYNLVIDGNRDNNTGVQYGVCVSSEATLDNCRIRKWNNDGTYRMAGTLLKCKFSFCGGRGVIVSKYGVAEGCESYANDEHGFEIEGEYGYVIDANAHHNTQYGCYANAINGFVSGRFWKNTLYGILANDYIKLDIISYKNANDGVYVDSYCSGKIVSYGNALRGVEINGSNNELDIISHGNTQIGIMFTSGGDSNNVRGFTYDHFSHYGFGVDGDDNVLEIKVLNCEYNNYGCYIGGDRNILRNTSISEGTMTQNYGLYILSAADETLIEHNVFTGTWASAIRDLGTNTKIRHNEGYDTENYLTNKTVNSTETTIAHELEKTPTKINILKTSDGRIWRSSASDATNIYLTADLDGRTCDIEVLYDI